MDARLVKDMAQMTFPTCGTCNLGVRDGMDLWCHARPPRPERRMIVETEDGNPHQKEVITSYYPIVGEDKPGCGLHPYFRKKWWGVW
jgi:hypothetical protein